MNPPPWMAWSRWSEVVHGDQVLALIIMSFAIVVGIIIDRLILPRLSRFATRRSWLLGTALIDAMRGLVIVWCALIGLGGIIAASLSIGRLANTATTTVRVAAIISLTILAARFLSSLTRRWTASVDGAIPHASITTTLMQILVALCGVLVGLDALGISIAPMLTALGVGGLAVALALQDTLTNLFAGIQIILGKKLMPGHYVRLDTKDEGYIHDISWRTTTIRTLLHTMVVIPNAKLATAIVTNYALPDPTFLFLVPYGVGYDSDLARVEAVSMEEATALAAEFPELMDATHPPTVRYTGFGDSSVNMQIAMRITSIDGQFVLRHALIKRLHRRFQAEQIEMPFPTRTVHLVRDP